MEESQSAKPRGRSDLHVVMVIQRFRPYFSGWGFSDEVGTYKPAPEIFAAALGMLGADAAEAVHVGDLRRTDIAGARAMGMGSIRYRGLADDLGPGPEADFVIDDHRELPPLVAGLG